MFGVMKRNFKDKTENKRDNTQYKNMPLRQQIVKCKFCRFTCDPKQCPTHGKVCDGCGKSNHSEMCAYYQGGADKAMSKTI